MRLLNTAQPLAGCATESVTASISTARATSPSGLASTPVTVTDSGPITVRWPTWPVTVDVVLSLRAARNSQMPPAIRMASPHSKAVAMRRRVLTRGRC